MQILSEIYDLFWYIGRSQILNLKSGTFVHSGTIYGSALILIKTFVVAFNSMIKIWSSILSSIFSTSCNRLNVQLIKLVRNLGRDFSFRYLSEKKLKQEN